jgi:hypothetical protein
MTYIELLRMERENELPRDGTQQALCEIARREIVKRERLIPCPGLSTGISFSSKPFTPLLFK